MPDIYKRPLLPPPRSGASPAHMRAVEAELRAARHGARIRTVVTMMIVLLLILAGTTLAFTLQLVRSNQHANEQLLAAQQRDAIILREIRTSVRTRERLLGQVTANDLAQAKRAQLSLELFCEHLGLRQRDCRYLFITRDGRIRDPRELPSSLEELDRANIGKSAS